LIFLLLKFFPRRPCRAFARFASPEPCTPTGPEVDAHFNGPTSEEQSFEEGNDDSETAVASLDSHKQHAAAASNAANGVGGAVAAADGFTSRLSSPPASPRVASMPPSPLSTAAPIPPLTAVAAYKLLTSRGPGAHTKESAAEVAAIVAAKRRLKAFLPGCPLASEHQVASVFEKAFMQVNTAIGDRDGAGASGFPVVASNNAEYIYNGPIYQSIVTEPSDTLTECELGSGALGSMIIDAAKGTNGDNNKNNNIEDKTANAPASANRIESGVLPDEEEDEIFMNLDPVLVDMDMSLLPDGRMW
jgi:hypothetical protein